MNIKKLPAKILQIAAAAGTHAIQLSFSGGSDEGHLQVHLLDTEGKCIPDPNGSLEDTVSEWAENAYEYSGVGDGSDYGDNIVYKLTPDGVKVTHQAWYTQTHHDNPVEVDYDEDAEVTE